MIKELNEFAKELKLYRENNTLPQGDAKNRLADIYEANFKPKWGLRKVDRGCPSCISDMMKCLCAEWYNSLNYFKAVPVVDFDRLKEEYNSEASVVKTYLDEESCLEELEGKWEQRDLENQIAEESVTSDYHDLDSEGLRELCDTLGIKYHHKNKRDTLIKKLDKYFND